MLRTNTELHPGIICQSITHKTQPYEEGTPAYNVVTLTQLVHQPPGRSGVTCSLTFPSRKLSGPAGRPADA